MFSPNLFSSTWLWSAFASYHLLFLRSSYIILLSLCPFSFLLLHYLYGFLCGLRLTEALWHPVILTAYEQYFSLSRFDGHEVTAITSLLFCVIIAECWSYVHSGVSLENHWRARKESGKNNADREANRIYSDSNVFIFMRHRPCYI